MTERTPCWYCGCKPVLSSLGAWECRKGDHNLGGPERDSEGDGWDALMRKMAEKCAVDRPARECERCDP
jgi:hypothetical protein